jgi:hypothetical protein
MSGRVVDVSSLQAVSGATIKVYAMNGTHLMGEAMSDSQGAFVVRGLAGGEYRLVFERSGYQRTAVAGVFVDPGSMHIEAAPIAMYADGVPLPKTAMVNPCGLVQPLQTADEYIVCSGD